MTTGRSSRCWKALYIYELDLIWVWTGWSASIITYSRIQVNFLLLWHESQHISGRECILITTSCCSRWWNALYIYELDLLWVRTGQGAPIITYIINQVRNQENHLLLPLTVTVRPRTWRGTKKTLVFTTQQTTLILLVCSFVEHYAAIWADLSGRIMRQAAASWGVAAWGLAVAAQQSWAALGWWQWQQHHKRPTVYPHNNCNASRGLLCGWIATPLRAVKLERYVCVYISSLFLFDTTISSCSVSFTVYATKSLLWDDDDDN